MSENLLRHLLALAGTFICALVWFAGYISGQYGWWWAFVGALLVYIIIYRLLSGGGHY